MRMEPSPRHQREDRIADPTVQNRHRSGHDLAPARRQTASLHQVVPFAQLFHKSGNLKKVIAAVSITHDDELTPRVGDTSHQSTAISFGGNTDQACPQLDRNFSRAIIAAVVCNDDFAGDSTFPDSGLRGPDAAGQGVSFVQTRNDHTEFDFVSAAAGVNRRTSHIVNRLRFGTMLSYAGQRNKAASPRPIYGPTTSGWPAESDLRRERGYSPGRGEIATTIDSSKDGVVFHLTRCSAQAQHAMKVTIRRHECH